MKETNNLITIYLLFISLFVYNFFSTIERNKQFNELKKILLEHNIYKYQNMYDLNKRNEVTATRLMNERDSLKQELDSLKVVNRILLNSK